MKCTGLVVTVLFTSFSCKHPSELSKEVMIDKESLTRRWKWLEKREGYKGTVLLDSAYELWFISTPYMSSKPLVSSTLHEPDITISMSILHTCKIHEMS